MSLITNPLNSWVPVPLSQINMVSLAGFSLRIEVAGEYYKITGESGHSEKKLTSSFYRLMKFGRKIPCSSWRILRSPMLNKHPALENQEQTSANIRYIGKIWDGRQKVQSLIIWDFPDMKTRLTDSQPLTQKIMIK